jgi:hypothetical protein
MGCGVWGVGRGCGVWGVKAEGCAACEAASRCALDGRLTPTPDTRHHTPETQKHKPENPKAVWSPQLRRTAVLQAKSLNPKP